MKQRLPLNFSTSFEHEFELIRYSINARIDLPGPFKKYTSNSISVINTRLKPVKSYFETTLRSFKLCCWFCSSQPVLFIFELTKCSYVPRESIFFNSCIVNKSGRILPEMSVQLSQKIKFFTPKRSKISARIIKEVFYFKKTNPKSFEKWSDSLVIPAVCPSSNGSYGIKDINIDLIKPYYPVYKHYSTQYL